MKSVGYPVYNIGHFQNSADPPNFYIKFAAEHYRQFNIVHDIHRHDHYVIIMCIAGHQVHEIDFVNYESKPGMIFILAPGHAHRYKMISDDTQGYVLYHDDDFYELNLPGHRLREYPFFCSGLNKPFVELKGENFKKVQDIFNALMKETSSDQLLKSRLLCNYVDSLYIHLTRRYIPDKKIGAHKKNYLDTLFQLEKLIEQNFKEIRQPLSYARMMNMSTKHLNRICKETIDKTTSELITKRVMLEAKRMLIVDSFSPEKVSIELGYFDHSHFSRMFKKSEGVAPLQFVSDYLSKNFALTSSTIPGRKRKKLAAV